MLLRASSAFITFALFLALFLAGLLTGLIPVPPHYNPFTPLSIKAPRTFVTPLKIWRLDRNLQLCTAVLRHAGLSFEPQPDMRAANGCAKIGTGLISSFSFAKLRPANVQMTCGLAVRLALFDEHVLQNAARDVYGMGVSTINHFGSYACRNVNHKKTGRLSKHASANAFDIAGLVLADGRDITVIKDWKKQEGGAFLRQLRDGACGLFSAVLSPDYNALHQNHFHFDTGFFTVCR